MFALVPAPYDLLLAAFRQLVPQLSQGAWDYLYPHLRQVTYARRAHCLDLGDQQRDLLFVASGLVRGYYLNDKGEDITIRFVAEGSYVVHYSALLQGQPSRYAFQCLEPTTLIALPYTAVQAGYDGFPDLERFGRRIAEQVLIAQQNRIEQFQFGSAEARYLAFVAAYPELFHRISLTHLASYLGIQRPSLSRIRQRLSRS